MRVLVADDEPVQLASLVGLCERIGGCSVVAQCLTGRTAVARAHDERPHVALLDIRMPDMDGLEAAAAIRSSLSHTTVVLVSAYSEFEYARRAIEIGVYRYLLKPVHIDDLAAVIHSLRDLYPQSENDYVAQIESYLKQNLSRPLCLEDVAASVHLSPSYVSRMYRSATGKTIWDTLTEFRMAKAHELLLHTNKTISEIAAATGYAYPGYFTRTFRRIYGRTPSELRM